MCVFDADDIINCTHKTACFSVYSEMFVVVTYQDVNAVDKNGWTSLHFAAFHGRLGCVQLLLRWGGHANDVENSGCNAGQKLYKLMVHSWHFAYAVLSKQVSEFLRHVKQFVTLHRG